MAKRALVISGGGSKGAFAVGVLKNLATNFPAINFDVIIGTSTGSLIAPFAALRKFDLLLQLYTTTTTDEVITKGNVVDRLLTANSLFDATPLANLIKSYYNDALCNQLLQADTTVVFTTTCLQTGESVNFSTNAAAVSGNYRVVTLTNPDEMRRAVMASACQPVFMQPIEVQKGAVPLRQYVDGGVKEYAGIQMAIDAGADEIFAILMTPEKMPTVEKTYNDAFTILQTTLDIFTSDVGYNDVRVPALYNSALQYISAVQDKMRKAGIAQADIDNYFTVPFHDNFTGKKPLKIYVIRPDAVLGGGPGGLDFNPDDMKRMVAKGQQTIDAFMASLPPDQQPLA